MPTTVQTALVVDDEAQIRRIVRNALSPDFACILETRTGHEAIDLAAARRPSLVVLDLGLPDMTGLDVCRELRRWYTAPIVVLSMRHADSEKAALLDAGADEYVTKPFGPAEFQARVHAVMQRRSHGDQDASSVEFGDMVMDLAAHTLMHNGAVVHLTPTEWALLCAFATHAGQVLTHQQLFTAVWGERQYGDAQQYLRVHVANLRRKIEEDSLHRRFIHTEPGIGYRFDPLGT